MRHGVCAKCGHVILHRSGCMHCHIRECDERDEQERIAQAAELPPESPEDRTEREKREAEASHYWKAIAWMPPEFRRRQRDAEESRQRDEDSLHGLHGPY